MSTLTKPQPDKLYVVETHDDIFLGRVTVKQNVATVRNGFVGHPVSIDTREIVSLAPAEGHPDVEVLL